MSSYCPICKTDIEKNELKTDSDSFQRNELTAMSDVDSESDGSESYESESEHEWRSDGDLEDVIAQDNTKEIYANVDKDYTNTKKITANVDKELDTEIHQRSKRALPRKNKVKMPSGKDVYITSPNSRGWKCGRRTKLITLHRHGKMGKIEYDIVASELENTKMDIPNCVNRGGCVKSFKVLKIRKIQNGCLWNRYQDRKHEIEREGDINERMLYHGTSKIWEIVGNGFDERFSSPNGIFGAGVYFAEKSSAANEYTFGILGGTGCPVHNNKSCTICIRRMLLCRVTLGKTHDNGTSGTKYPHAPVGFHSVKGKNGPTNYTEFIVYRGEQAYPEYLISYTIQV